MAKGKNKGFTLIEVMIAIAILTILLIPIMKQFTQTLETSRKAKELQYANEGAAYALEFAQRNDLATLSTGTTASDNIKELSLADTPVRYENATAIECSIYNTSGSQIAGADGKVSYNAYTYKLNDLELGARNILYHRNVVYDDLSLQLADKLNTNSKGYKIAYNMTKADLSAFPEGFELTNEGSIVKYENNLVTAVACTEVDKVDNPNNTNLGNMQDLDATKVAIIAGTGSNFDEQAEKAFYLKAMELLKEKDYESYTQALLHASGDSILNTIDYLDSLHKLTKIYIDFEDCSTADKKDDYYIIKADVYYTTTYSITADNVTYSDSAVLKYNVFSQKFYTDKCPDVYFEYQPFTKDYNYAKKTGKVTYADEDDIMIDNFVVNKVNGVDENVKIYLYKPTSDQSNVAYGTTDNLNAYYTTAESNKKVKIFIYRSNDKVKYADIYTNLDITGQFHVLTRNTISSVSTDSTVYTSTTRSAYDPNCINPLADDKRTSERLMRVTVRLEPDSNSYNDVVLTGAKGDN